MLTLPAFGAPGIARGWWGGRAPNRDTYTPNPRKSARPPLTARIGSDSMLSRSGSILTPSDRAHLVRMMRRHTPSPVHRQMNALLLLDDGWAAERVADALFIDAETVREHRRLHEPGRSRVAVRSPEAHKDRAHISPATRRL
jgi:hypothetical protein